MDEYLHRHRLVAIICRIGHGEGSYVYILPSRGPIEILPEHGDSSKDPTIPQKSPPSSTQDDELSNIEKKR